jgi:acyl dehydratase
MSEIASYPTVLDSATIVIGQEKIDLFAELSNDFNPIHVDVNARETIRLGGIIAHGTLSLNLIWISLEKTFPHEISRSFILDVRLRAPAYLGDILKSGGNINLDGHSYSVWVTNQNDKKIIEGTFSFDSNVL